MLERVYHSFEANYLFFILLPIAGSPLQVRFSSLYTIAEKLSETNYVVRTPDRRKKSRVCHVNMIKLYVGKERNGGEAMPISTIVTTLASFVHEDDDLRAQVETRLCARLSNSEILKNINTQLNSLSINIRNYMVKLMREFPSIFSDDLSPTTVLFHDVDVTNAAPIKQPPYRVNHFKRDTRKVEVDYLLKHGLAVPSSSPWSSPCLFVHINLHSIHHNDKAKTEWSQLRKK